MEGEVLFERDPKLRQYSKLVRRATFKLNDDLVRELSQRSWGDAVNALVNLTPGPADPPVFEETEDLIKWWINQMFGPQSGVHERMTWFWHGVLTTHRNKAGDTHFVREQLKLLRTHALGNYREMLHAFVVDGALLRYLDGDGSQASKPNENLSRELMELFTLGVGNYTEDDVRSGARALAGWRIDNETKEVYFDRERAFVAPLMYRGVQADWDTTKIVDHLCDDPMTATYISRKLWHYLGGGWLNEKDSKRLGNWWRDKNLEIKPLVEKVLNDTKDGTDYARPRTGIEFYYAFSSVVGKKDVAEDRNRMRNLGQTPYEPPNVAGWPTDNRWIEPGSMLVRGNMAYSINFDDMANWEAGTTDEVLNRCGLYAVSDNTLNRMNEVETEDFNEEDKTRTRWRIALNSPEFQLL